MKIKLAAAAVAAVMIMSGCAKEKDESEITPENQTESSISVPTAAYSVTEPDGAAQDVDPQALAHKDDNMPFFFSKEPEEVSFYPDERSVKFNGRYIEHKETLYLAYTCSSVSFKMTGDRVEAVMVSNGGVYSQKQQGWIGVMIDGELVKRIKLDDGENSYVLYEGEKLENAEITIIKLSENQMAATGIKSITCNASRLAPSADRDVKIEFIGDSLTCGYGNEAESPSDGLNSAQQNGAATYGYFTAQKLNADWSMVCVSGLGVVSDYTGIQGMKEDYLLIDDIYTYSDSNFQMRRGMDDYTPWDFNGGSDIVVINLGTNDYTYTGEDEDLQDEFENGYYSLICSVRENNPNADIICTLGISGAELLERIESAAVRFSSDYGDDRIYTMKFDYQSEEDGFGGDYHPTVKTHEKAAAKLAEFIESDVW